jgi:hypothetical protein
MKIQRFGAAATLALAFTGCGSPHERVMDFRLVEGQPMYDVLPQDGIPSIDEPVFVDAATAAEFMRDDEPVLGLVAPDGTAKCYSAWHLDRHEIVNDTLGDQPVAVTW